MTPSPQSVQIAIISGEASGDRVGAQLAREIHHLRPGWELFGTGGKHLRDAGVELLVDSSRWGVVGVAQGLALLPKIIAASSDLKTQLQRRKPSLIIPIDAGAFNLGFAGMQGLCPWARQHMPETAILYYFPPGSWRRILKRTSLKENTDLVATPFPWSESELIRLGVNAQFVGHPLLDLVAPSEPPATFADRFGIETEHPVVGLFPGSRRAEIEHILPAQLMAAEIIRRRVPGVQFLIALASTVDKEAVFEQVEKYQAFLRARQSKDTERGEVERRLREWEEATGIGGGRVPVSADGQFAAPEDLVRRQKKWIQKASGLPEPEGPLPLVLVEDMAYDVMTASDVVIMASGTATLEAAILGKPMVILYKMSRWNKPQYWLVRKSLPPYIGLPNLLADKRIVPEFVQDDATPDALAESVIDYLLEPDRMLRTREDLAAVRALLGKPGGAPPTPPQAVYHGERQKHGNGSAIGTVK
ncbi:MAG: hypothetical protein H8F28_06195 [Fibrella sp.]|nr:hypothetical protein [Armatimonadota bacterium]